MEYLVCHTRKRSFILPNTSENIYNNQFVNYTYDPYSEYSFKSNDIEKLYEDRFNNIWLAHKDGGISMVYKGSQNINTIFRIHNVFRTCPMKPSVPSPKTTTADMAGILYPGAVLLQ